MQYPKYPKDLYYQVSVYKVLSEIILKILEKSELLTNKDIP